MLRDLHHYTYEIDAHAWMTATEGMKPDPVLTARVAQVNNTLLQNVLMSSNRTADYFVSSAPQFSSNTAGSTAPPRAPRMPSSVPIRLASFLQAHGLALNDAAMGKLVTWRPRLDPH